MQGALSHASHYNRIPVSQFQPCVLTKLTRFASIMQYLQETVAENDLEQHISLGVRVLSADWDTALRSWNLVLSLTDKNGAKTERGLRCGMLYMCSGYFSYDTPHDPALPGVAKFKGTVLHPQFWPEPSPSLAGKQVNSHSFSRISPRAFLFSFPAQKDAHVPNALPPQVVVIGSGATAMTIVPALANAGVRVTMLQRSPRCPVCKLLLLHDPSYHVVPTATSSAVQIQTP